DQFLFALPGGAEVRAVAEQIVRVERRVQPVKADPGRRILPTDAGGDADAETERRVHRDGDQDEPGAANPLDVERLHRDGEHGRAEAGALEKRRRPGDGERLMAELVAGDEENGARFSHRGHSTPLREGVW